jgi:hypothetical protein
MLVLPSPDNDYTPINQIIWLDLPLCIDRLAVQVEATHRYQRLRSTYERGRMSGQTTLLADGNVLVLLVTPWFTVSLSTVVPYISSTGIDTRRGSPERAAKTSSAFTEDTSVPKRTLVIDLACLTPSTDEIQPRRDN